MNSNATSPQDQLRHATFGAMEPMIWKGDFWAVETSDGLAFVEDEIMGWLPTLEDFREYTEGDPESFQRVKGWGAYLTMPGYLDRTDLAVFNTEDEAIEHLLEQADEYEEEE